MPRGRPKSKLTESTDAKVDGAYADIVAPPRVEGDPTGQTLAIQNQIDAIGGPLAQEVAATGGMPNVQNIPPRMGDELFGLSDIPNQPGKQISDRGEIFNANANRVEALKSLILEKYPHRAIKNRLL